MARTRQARGMTAKRAKARGSPRPAAKKTPRGGSSTAAAKPDRRLAEAERLLAQNNFSNAFRVAQAVLRDYPTDWRALEFVAPLLLAMNHLEMGLGALEAAIAHAPDSAEIRKRLAVSLMNAALKTERRLYQAILAGQNTIARHGPNAAVYNLLTQALSKIRRHDEAVKTADEAIALFPKAWALYFNKSLALLRMGKLEEAVAAYAGGLLPLGSTPGKSADELRQQYHSLAAGYDDNKLHQSFSARMAGFMNELAGATPDKRVLDAGCGTGLLATHLKAARLVGIDMSPEMLAQARTRGLYDELIEADLIAAMAARTDSFDIVASACVLYHIADLAPFFREAARLLVPGGYLFFSVDPAPDEMDIACPFVGDFAHSRAYLRRRAAENGFAEVAIRIMPHRVYPGFWCAFRRDT